MHLQRRALAVVALAVALAAPAAAQVTGSMSGYVFDQNGTVVSGATVKVSGDVLPAGRTFTTDENGYYKFTALPPGTYTVEVTRTDVGTSKRQAVVELDREARIDMVIGVTVEESIEVAAAAPAVDLGKAEVNFNYKADELAALPLERNYRGLFQLIPGVADNRSAVGPSAGGTRQDNTYLIDGVNITNPGFGSLNVEVNDLDIAEVNIKRAGVSAEFGRTAGVVTNAVSKSGTNTLSGAARITWLPSALIADFRDDAFRDSLVTETVSPAVSVGGPIIRDKLFWYGSARYFESVGFDRRNKLGTPLPDTKTTGHELYGKITAAPTPRHLINVSYRDRPNDTENSGLGASTEPSVATTTDNSSRVATASWTFFFTDRNLVDVKYLFMKENNEDDPITALGYLPTWNPNNLAAMGYYLDPAKQNTRVGGGEYFNQQNYKRHEIKGAFTQFLDIGATGHEIKVGVGYEFGEEDLWRLSNGWGDLQRVTVSGVPRIRARYYFEQSPQLGQGTTWSIYVQDNMTIGTRLTVNAGVLLNRDDFTQDLPDSGGCPAVTLSGGVAVYESDGDRCTFLRFPFGDEIQPRLGFNYNLRKNAGDKVYANWGRYYNMDQKSSGRSLAPRRIYQFEAQYLLDGTLVSNAPRAATTGKLIDPDLEPIYHDEVLVGYATPIGQHLSVDVFYMYRNTESFIDDVPSRLPDTGPYAAANLPCDRFDACRGFEADRTYKAISIEVARRLANRWSASASYTYSQFEGNYDLDYAGGAVFNTSSIIQDGPGTNIQEDGRYGPLRQERPHVFKLFGNWVPLDALTVGGYFRVQSGTPWNARGQDTQSASAMYYLEPAGSHRNKTWANFDLNASYKFRFGGRTALSLDAVLLNVFGNQTQTSTDSVKWLDTNRLTVPPYIAPGTNPNLFFGTANGYAPPRRLIVGATFSF